MLSLLPSFRSLPTQWSAGLQSKLAVAADTCAHGSTTWREGMYTVCEGFISAPPHCVVWTLCVFVFSFCLFLWVTVPATNSWWMKLSTQRNLSMSPLNTRYRHINSTSWLCRSYTVGFFSSVNIWKWMCSSFQDIIELVRNKTGLNKTTVETVWSVYDTLFCEVKAHTHTHSHKPPLAKNKLKAEVKSFVKLFVGMVTAYLCHHRRFISGSEKWSQCSSNLAHRMFHFKIRASCNFWFKNCLNFDRDIHTSHVLTSGGLDSDWPNFSVCWF